MKKIKVAEASGGLLDWLVARCEGFGIEFEDPRRPWLTRDGISVTLLRAFNPSTKWHEGGPIIERERIEVVNSPAHEGWLATSHGGCYALPKRRVYADGPTPLIAAMRCFCASRLGDEVEVPDEIA